MKYLISLFIILIPIYFITLPKEENIEKVVKAENNNTELVVKLKEENTIFSIPLENYLIGVLACEMPASFENEALKAQAIASRTYAMEKMNQQKEYDLENSTNNQCYITIKEMQEKWKSNYNLYYDKINKAIKETNSMFMTYNNKIIKAFYFSTSNGYTENVQNVFGEKLEYLISTDSHWDKKVSSYERNVSFTIKEFLKALSISEDTIKNINIIDRSETGRINYIMINNNKFKGTTLRSLLGLRSTDFDIEVEDSNVNITTRGYGHGVGLSQYGANEMAKLGYSYDEILKHYYKNIEIKTYK